MLTRDIHLQAHLQWRQVPGPLVAQAPGYSAAIHAVNPGKMFGYGTGLIGLDGADEMPGHWQLGERRYLCQRLLQVAFAEMIQAVAVGGADGLGRVGFAHREHPDIPGGALAFFSRESYSLK